MATLVPRPVNALRQRLRGIAQAVGETRAYVVESRVVLEERLSRLESALSAVQADNRLLNAKVQALLAQEADHFGALEAASQQGNEARERLLEVAKLTYHDEPRQRERLWMAREATTYQEAYRDPQPLVTVVIPTYTNHELLATRSIPSVLAQTYQNFEIQVVGDAAPAQTAEAILEFDDPRISYHNLPTRGPYPSDPVALWRVAGTLPWIEAVHRARGRWIAPVDDDDAFLPHHIEALLELARRDRLEVCYGQLRMHLADGDTRVIGAFPPCFGEFGFQGALYHADLRFFVPELADAIFSLPGDWATAERMLRTGVRFGMLDDVVVDYFPSWDRDEQTAEALFGTRRP